MANQWQIKQADKVLGPFSDSQLRQLVASGRVNRKTPIRGEENSIWMVAGRIPGLFPDELLSIESDQSIPVAPAPNSKGLSESADVQSPAETKSDEVWHVTQDGGEMSGPFSFYYMKQQASLGKLRPTDFVCKQGMDDWIPASTLKGLAFREATDPPANSSAPKSQSKAKFESADVEGQSAPDSEQIWVVGRDGKTYGRFSDEQLNKCAQSGWLRPTDLVWKTGYEEWKSASTVAGLFQNGAKQAVPPPLPANVSSVNVSSKPKKLNFRGRSLCALGSLVVGVGSFLATDAFYGLMDSRDGASSPSEQLRRSINAGDVSMAGWAGGTVAQRANTRTTNTLLGLGVSLICFPIYARRSKFSDLLFD